MVSNSFFYTYIAYKHMYIHVITCLHHMHMYCASNIYNIHVPRSLFNKNYIQTTTCTSKCLQKKTFDVPRQLHRASSQSNQ